MNTIEQVKAQIEVIEEQIKAKQSEIDNFEYEMTDEQYDELLDEIYGDVEVCGNTYNASYALKELDPIAYRVGKSDYESSYDLDEVEDYQNLQSELEDLESELESLEEQLEELEDLESEDE